MGRDTHAGSLVLKMSEDTEVKWRIWVRGMTSGRSQEEAKDRGAGEGNE
jgi:hypothetical protein